MKRPLIGFPTLLALLEACGTAAGPSYGPPLTTFNGTIASSSVATPAIVHVALVWKILSGPHPSYFGTAQELGVRAEFPASFHLDVKNLPPPEAMKVVDPAKVRPGGVTAFALGALVVYEDTNGNGKLDLLPIDAPTSVDRFLGTPEGLEIIYLEGGGIAKNPQAPPTDEDFVEHFAGFNLIVEPELAFLEPGCSSCERTAIRPWTRLDNSANLTIALTADPQLARALCDRTGGEETISTGTCGPCIGSACSKCPVAAGARVTCSADKSAFVALSCDAASICANRVCRVVSGRLDASHAVPPNWPCP